MEEFGEIVGAIMRISRPKPSQSKFHYEATNKADYVTLTTPIDTLRATIANGRIRGEINGVPVAKLDYMMFALERYYKEIR